jgi:hypothetical protein
MDAGACRHVGGDDRLLWHEDFVLAASLHVPQRYGRGGSHRRDQLDWQPRRRDRPHRGRLAQGYDRQLRNWPVLPLGMRAGLGHRHPGCGARAALAGRAYGHRNDTGVTNTNREEAPYSCRTPAKLIPVTENGPRTMACPTKRASRNDPPMRRTCRRAGVVGPAGRACALERRGRRLRTASPARTSFRGSLDGGSVEPISSRG